MRQLESNLPISTNALPNNESMRCLNSVPSRWNGIQYHLAGPDSSPFTIVLIHGFISDMQTWAPLVHQLSQAHRVLSYDQPGHGRSATIGQDFSPPAMAELLKSLLDATSTQRIFLVGHSMGARTALEFAHRYPTMVEGLLIEDMHIAPVAESIRSMQKALARFEYITDLNLPIEYPSYHRALRSLLRFYTFKECLWVLAAAKTLANGGVRLIARPEVTELYLHQGFALNMSEQLQSLACPISIFAGDPRKTDTILKGPVLNKMRLLRPDAHFYCFTGQGHTLHKSETFLERLLKLIPRNTSRF